MNYDDGAGYYEEPPYDARYPPYYGGPPPANPYRGAAEPPPQWAPEPSWPQGRAGGYGGEYGGEYYADDPYYYQQRERAPRPTAPERQPMAMAAPAKGGARHGQQQHEGREVMPPAPVTTAPTVIGSSRQLRTVDKPKEHRGGGVMRKASGQAGAKARDREEMRPPPPKRSRPPSPAPPSPPSEAELAAMARRRARTSAWDQPPATADGAGASLQHLAALSQVAAASQAAAATRPARRLFLGGLPLPTSENEIIVFLNEALLAARQLAAYNVKQEEILARRARGEPDEGVAAPVVSPAPGGVPTAAEGGTPPEEKDQKPTVAIAAEGEPAPAEATPLALALAPAPAANAPPDPPTSCVLSVLLQADKFLAFAEMESPEDVDVALQLDGIKLKGQTIRVRRPRDHVESMLAVGSSVRPPPVVPDIVPDSPSKIYVGRLPATVGRDAAWEIFTCWGQVRAFRWLPGVAPATGCIFLDYVDPAVAPAAVAGIRHLSLAGQRLVSVLATPDAAPYEGEPAGAMVAGVPANYDVPASVLPLMAPPHRVICFRGVIPKGATSGDADAAEMAVRAECGRFGIVLSSHAPKSANTFGGVGDEDDDPVDTAPPSGAHGDDDGACVYVEMARRECAITAAQALHLRRYKDAEVTVTYFPVRDYRKRFKKSTMGRSSAALIAARNRLNELLLSTNIASLPLPVLPVGLSAMQKSFNAVPPPDRDDDGREHPPSLPAVIRLPM